MTAWQPSSGILGVRTEIQPAGTWTDISTYTWNNSTSPGVAITRGRPDEASQISPSQAMLALNNADGRFSSLNPLGAYYGTIGRNTPLRVSVPEGASYLRSETDQFSFASAPDSAGLSITGDMEVRVDVTLDNWNADQVLASKWVASGSERSWILLLNEDGTLTFAWTADGSTIKTVSSTQPVPMPALNRQAIKATLAVSTGQVKFFTAATISGTYTQLGSAASRGSTSVFDSTAVLRVGAPGAAVTSDYPSYTGIYGKVHGFMLLSGIGGTTEASPDFTSQAAGATSFTDGQGNTWTLQGTAEISDRNYRYHGEVAAWPQQWDPTGTAVWVSVTASGVLRRLGRSQRPLDSPMTRYWKHAADQPVIYWPMEDLPGGHRFTPAIGSQVMGINGKPKLASNTSFVCSNALPVMNGAECTGLVPAYSSTGQWAVRFLLSLDSSISSTAPIIDVNSSVNASSLSLFYETTGTDLLVLSGPGGNCSVAVSPGTPYLVSVEMASSGGNITPSLSVMAVGGSVTTASITATAGSAGVIRSVVTGPSYDTSVPLFQNLGNSVIGQLAVLSAYPALSDAAGAFDAFLGEAAGVRFARLCSEEGIAFRGQGQLDADQIMGYQTQDTLANLLQYCCDAGQGIITEPRQCLGLGYRTLSSLYQQQPAVALDYSLASLSALTPTDDDRYTVNDVTVTVNGGSSARVVQESGPLSVQPVPDGVGTYDQEITVVLASDAQALQAAGWRVHLGTINEPRYPAVVLNLARTALASLQYAIAQADLGDRFTVASTPVWLPPDGISQLAAQFAEQLGGYVWTIAPTWIPEDPYKVALAADPVFGHVETDAAQLLSSISGSQTSITVKSTGVYLWTTSAGDFPFDIDVDGERMTVTSITGTGANQSFTVTRHVNGVVKGHSAGAAVTLFYPAYTAL